jgi:DNA-binding transcriptional ArsR family regulator
MHAVHLVSGVAHMPVIRVRTRRDARQEDGIAYLRGALLDAADAVPADVLDRVVHLLDRELSSRRGWRFVMVEPNLYADVVEYLIMHSRRPQKAVVLFTRLFSYLPPDGNEVMADREELARVVGIQPAAVSEIMRELETVGAVYRRREGRGVRYFVNPKLGTHLSGAARDRAQAEAPMLRLVETEPVE